MSEDLSFSSGKHRFLDLPFTKPARNLFHHRPIELLAFKARHKYSRDHSPNSTPWLYLQTKQISTWVKNANNRGQSFQASCEEVNYFNFIPIQLPTFSSFWEVRTPKKVNFLVCWILHNRISTLDHSTRHTSFLRGAGKH